MKPETRFKEKVMAALKTLPFTWHVKTQQRSVRGIPDLLLCVRGHFVAAELKATPEEDPDPLQEFNLAKITRSGGIAVTIHPGNWPAFFSVLIQVATGKVILQQAKEDIERVTARDH